jgi:hypothetical protein
MEENMLKVRHLFTIIMSFILLSSIGYSVDQYGVLSGSVVDESGVGLPGVEVSVTGPALMGKRITITNNEGSYRISRLSVGKNFTVTYTLEGFKPVTMKDVRIALGKETRLPVLMKFGKITEMVEVNGEIPIVDPTSSSNQLNIGEELVSTLATDRNYQTVMEMMPGAIPGSNPMMLGGSSSDNIYQFDGMDSTDPLTKTWSTSMNFDNFEEMQVITQGLPPEYGRGTGAVINVVTKSGGNKVSGTARLEVSKVDWNAKAKETNKNFSDATRYLNETRPAFTLGGPIIKDHIWFFGSYERRNKWKPATWHTSPQDGLTNSPSGSGRGYYKGHYASLKLTAKLGPFSMMGMWNEDPTYFPEMSKYNNDMSSAHASDSEKEQGGWNMNAELTTILGPSTYLETRFTMKRSDLNILAHQTTGTRFYQSGYYWGAGYYDYRTDRDFQQYLINLNHFTNTSFGYHDLKIGFEYFDIDVMGAINYTYPGGDFIYYDADGKGYIRYVYEIDVPKKAAKYNDMMVFFLNDRWEVSKGLTLNLGVRFEKGTWKNHSKETILEYGWGDMIAPRIGVTYAFGKNKISFNWNRVYDLYGFFLVDNFQPDAFVRRVKMYYGESMGYSDWTFYREAYATAPASQTTMDENLKPQYVDQFGINFERALSKRLALSINYIYKVWRDKLEDYDLDGDYIYHFTNGTDYHDQNENWGNTFKKYKAFIVQFKKNLGDDKYQFLASYTWSKLRGFSGDDSEGAWGDTPYGHINALGYLPGDVRHQVRFNGSVLLPLDIIFGCTFAWYSGQPYTETAGIYYEDGGQTGHDGSYLSVFLDPQGTSGRLPAQWRMDFHIEKLFKIKKLFETSVYIDMFNVLNYQGEKSRNCNLGRGILLGEPGSRDIQYTYENPQYGQFTTWAAPMSFKLGVKVKW